jgi:hypothetical protein
MTEAEAIKFLRGHSRHMVASRPILVPELIARYRSGAHNSIFLSLTVIVLAGMNLKHSTGFWLYLNIAIMIMGLANIGYGIFRLFRARAVWRALDLGAPREI